MFYKFLTRFRPIIPFKSYPAKHSQIVLKIALNPIIQPRNFAEKGKDAKEETPKAEKKVDAVKMPGMVHPEALNEEGYFEKKARQHLQEIRRKQPDRSKQDLTNPEKKQ